MIDPSRVRVSGPLESYACGFAVELSRQGYAPVSARLQLHLVAHLSRWLAGEELGAALTPLGVTQVVSGAARRAGLGPIHAHRLRHTAASEMLRAGAPLPEIGQVLRHRRLASTAIYAKVDREALRSLAREWPGGAA